MQSRQEIQLLLCCARTVLDAQHAAQIRRLVRSNLDWTYLLQTALQHRVTPLLYWNLHATCPKAVPVHVLDQLQRHFHANTRYNLFLVRELLALLSMLEEHGIRAIPYKGPVLAVAAYGNIALRQFGDLDILVREQDAVRAKELFLARGYRLQYQASAAYERLFRRFRQTYDFMREDGQVFVELHWNVISWPTFFNPDVAFLWECPAVVCLADTPVRRLAPEDALPVLCVHGAKHYWERLGWICDVAELVRVHSGLQWNRVLQQASRIGGVRPLYLGLLLARSLLGAAVPEDVLRQVQGDRIVAMLAAHIQTGLFARADGLLRSLEQHVSYLLLEEGLRDKGRCSVYLLHRLIGRLMYYAIGPHVWRHD